MNQDSERNWKVIIVKSKFTLTLSIRSRKSVWWNQKTKQYHTKLQNTYSGHLKLVHIQNGPLFNIPPAETSKNVGFYKIKFWSPTMFSISSGTK